MSRFFKNLDDEKEEITKKKEIFYEDQVSSKLNKKELKINELKSKVENINKDKIKNFEKNGKKLFNELKKYTKYFDESLPNFLKDFLNNENISKSKQLIKLKENFLAQFNQNTNINEKNEKKIIKKKKNKEETFDEILALENDQKLEKLESFYLNNGLNKKCIIPLFSIYNKKQNDHKMIDLLKNYTPEDDHIDNIIKKNLEKFLLDILKILNKNNYKDFINLIENINNFYNINNVLLLFYFYYSYNEEVHQKFFEVIENSKITYPYNLIDLIRKEDFENFLKIFNIEKLEDLSLEKSYNLFPLKEIGSFLLEKKKLEDSFYIFNLCNKFENLKKEIYILCVLLEEKICDENIFKKFLEDFKSFDENIFLLESENEYFEIYRAFYASQNYDLENSQKILKNLTGLDFKDILEKNIIKRVKNK